MNDFGVKLPGSKKRYKKMFNISLIYWRCFPIWSVSFVIINRKLFPNCLRRLFVGGPFPRKSSTFFDCISVVLSLIKLFESRFQIRCKVFFSLKGDLGFNNPGLWYCIECVSWNKPMWLALLTVDQMDSNLTLKLRLERSTKKENHLPGGALIAIHYVWRKIGDVKRVRQGKALSEKNIQRNI